MGAVRHNPIQGTVRTAHLSVLITMLNFSTQYNGSGNLPSYLQTTIIAQLLSIGEEGGISRKEILFWVRANCHVEMSWEDCLRGMSVEDY